jgi:hypothetical protein
LEYYTSERKTFRERSASYSWEFTDAREERDKRERRSLLRESVFSVRRTFERDERKEARKGSPRFGLLSVHLGIGLISLSLRDDDDDDFFNEQRRFCDDDDENANECENQQRHALYFFYHRKQQREKRRKDEDEKRKVVFFVFVARTTGSFSHTKEGVY